MEFILSSWAFTLIFGNILVSPAIAQFNKRHCDPYIHNAHPSKCRVFVTCATGIEMNCPANLVFNDVTQRCDYSFNIPGCTLQGLPTVNNPCDSVTCPNSQVCAVTNSNAWRYNCRCPLGYQGQLCDEDVNECLAAKNPCQNNGKCVNTDGAFYCDCSGTGRYGMRCDRPFSSTRIKNACDSNPCQAPKLCQTSAEGYICICPPGRQGPDCQQEITDPCNPNPCGENTQCVAKTVTSTSPSYTCQCLPGFSGTSCKELLPVPDCPVYPCPADVPSYNYPNWSDQQCDSYYNCQRGQLTLKSCPRGQQFDIVSNECRDTTDTGAYFYCSLVISF